ncbi:MAG: AMP-binding enzyme, partial [Pseudomonadales bacterium]
YCAVIGVPDDDSGEAVKLFLVSSNSNLTEEEVRSFYANQLARYKWPRDIVFRDELPLSNIGKVLRRELRDN